MEPNHDMQMKIGIFLVGLILGALGGWYGAEWNKANYVQKAIQSYTENPSNKVAPLKQVTGVVSAVNTKGNYFNISVSELFGIQIPAEYQDRVISVGSNTEIYIQRFSASKSKDGNPIVEKIPVKLADLKVGSTVTVVSEADIQSAIGITAKEVIIFNQPTATK